MAKRMKSERSGARKRAAAQDILDPGASGAIPPEAIPQEPTPPQDSTAMAKGGVELNRGNSNQQPLSDIGQQAADETAAGLAQHGGVDTLKSSTAVRAMQTADKIASADPQQPQVQPDPGTESWAQGNLEGIPAKPVKKLIHDLVRKYPSYRIPGQGAMSTKPGESFDDFRMRALPRIKAAMQELALDPSKTIGIVLHSQVIRLIEAWIKEGCPDDFHIDPNTFLKQSGEAPGSVERLYPEKSGDWKTQPVDLKAKGALTPGSIYLIRHGMTESNKENYEKAGNGATAQNQIAKHIKSMDFGRARAIAKTARDAGQLSDEDISKTITQNLPSAQEAEGMPNHHLLAAASAAGPGQWRKPELGGIAANRFSTDALSKVSPEAQAALNPHLASIGLNRGMTQ